MEPLLLYIFYFACINLLVLLAGYVLIKQKMVFAGWVLLAAAITGVYYIFLHVHPIIRMFSLIAVTFSGMKVIAVTESYKHKFLTLTFKQWVIFTWGWAGMRAGPFEKLGTAPVPGGWPMIKTGISRVVAGLLLILAGHKMMLLPCNIEVLHIVVSAVLLIGLSLILHFGLLGISAGLWRFFGVNTCLLFRQPAKARSLTAFWGKRWNIAFSEMASIAIFRPLKNKTGSPAALLSAFIFSGLLHELALSVPVNSGYGLPLLYFVIQGIVVLAEKLWISGKINFMQNNIIAAVWVFFWLVAPTPLLFSPQFIKQIVWPLTGVN